MGKVTKAAQSAEGNIGFHRNERERVKKSQHRKWRCPTPPQPSGIHRRSVGLKWWIGLVALVGMAFCVSIVWNQQHPALSAANRLTGTQHSNTKLPATLNDLLALRSLESRHCDIALMNLLCAQGLPGAKGLDVTNCLLTLNAWARHVQTETDRNFHQFRDNPADFYNSEGYFRMLMMAAVMYEDFGIRYNPARIVTVNRLGAPPRSFPRALARVVPTAGRSRDAREGACAPHFCGFSGFCQKMRCTPGPN
jgi:hypothetical protein